MMETESIVRALEAFSRGERPDRPTIKILHDRGYITVSDVTNMQSHERGYLAIWITEKGRELPERWKKKSAPSFRRDAASLKGLADVCLPPICIECVDGIYLSESG